MVNYCCVYGCGRNSRLNRHLIFYSIPKEINRQALWLKAAGREDLLTKDEKAIGRRRFCSRHFNASCIKKRNLSADAVPTLHIPGSEGEETDWGAECLRHEGIVCNNCQDTVSGFRYKCVSCTDYDLCQKCEGLEVHPDHFMLRIPKPMKLVVAENLTKQLHDLIKAEHLTPDETSAHNGQDEGTVDIDSESSDDEPITKYASNYDSGVDLSEDVKERIRKEVSRVLKLKPKKSKAKTKTSADKKRTSDESPRLTKKPKLEETSNYNSNTLIETMAEVEIAPEVAFADVNAVKDNQASGMKGELSESVNTSETVPVMHLKLSDDLSELMIEVTSNNSKTVYKYGDNRWNRGNLGSS